MCNLGKPNSQQPTNGKNQPKECVGYYQNEMKRSGSAKHTSSSTELGVACNCKTESNNRRRTIAVDPGYDSWHERRPHPVGCRAILLNGDAIHHWGGVDNQWELRKGGGRCYCLPIAGHFCNLSLHQKNVNIFPFSRHVRVWKCWEEMCQRARAFMRGRLW